MRSTHAEIVQEMLKGMEEVRLKHAKRLEALDRKCPHTEMSEWLLADAGMVQVCKGCQRMFNRKGEMVA